MPKAAPIDPQTILAIFDYDPTTGALLPKLGMGKAVRQTDTRQWEIGRHRYSLHRLVWAWHNPNQPNPKYVTFKDSNCYNTRIENLRATSTHPRWAGHTKQRKALLDTATGAITFIDPLDAKFDYE